MDVGEATASSGENNNNTPATDEERVQRDAERQATLNERQAALNERIAREKAEQKLLKQEVQAQE